MPQLIPKFLSVNVTVCLYASTQKVCEVTEENTIEDDEGSDEETNATEERGRRWLKEEFGRGTRTF